MSAAAPETPDHRFDVVVVGSGAAGLSAAITAARQGLRAVVVEKAARREPPRRRRLSPIVYTIRPKLFTPTAQTSGLRSSSAHCFAR
ncbi:MAG: FAD-binding protein, partial [Saccharopolyspora sp.]|nr:FAD-binding protein [Saccharopolyspora sp.]